MNTPTQPTHKYKNSSLGLIPEDWEVKKFKEVAKFYSGGTPSTSVKEYYIGEIPFIKSGEIYGSKTAQFLNEMGLDNSSAKMVFKGDILYALYGANSGEAAISQIDGAINQAVLCIKTELSKVFVLNFLVREKDNIVKKYLQGGQGNLSADIVKKLDIPIPPLPEQTAIANCLSTWDKAIEKQTALIAQKELSKKALMQQLLSGKKRLKGFSGEWKEFSLGGISDYVKGFAFSSESYKNEGVRIIRISDTTSDSIKNEGGIYVDEIEAYKFKKWELKEHDLVFTTVGSRPPLYDSMVGKVIKIEKKFEGSLLNQNAVIIRGKEIVNQVFLYNQFKNRRYLEFVESIVRGNANQVSVTLENLFSYKIKLPSIEEQVAIANLLQCADTEIQLLKTKLIQLKEQKKGLMQVLLTGKKRLKY